MSAFRHPWEASGSSTLQTFEQMFGGGLSDRIADGYAAIARAALDLADL
jgi:hypothetical protein